MMTAISSPQLLRVLNCSQKGKQNGFSYTGDGRVLLDWLSMPSVIRERNMAIESLSRWETSIKVRSASGPFDISRLMLFT